MQRDIKVGSISWINELPNPVWFSGKAAILDPAWVPKTYMGLAATANTSHRTQLAILRPTKMTRIFAPLCTVTFG